MKRCPITYLPLKSKKDYSEEGVRLLSQKVEHLNHFPYAQSQQLELSFEYADKLSVQGVQPKLSAKFDEEKGTFKPTLRDGTYILKLQHRTFLEVPQNEDLTMRLAKMVGIEIPFHGMIYAVDGTLLYFIERFDRQRECLTQNLSLLAKPKKRQMKTLHKTPLEDFAQLAGLSRDTKYDFSMEKLVPIVQQYCTFPQNEKKKLFRLTLFSFLVGNEDLHLKNFSLIRHADLTAFSPAYDLVNSSILLKSREELALPLRGKKSNLNRDDLVTYYGQERLELPERVTREVLEEIEAQIPAWKELVGISFLSEVKKQAYLEILESRAKRLFSR